MNLGRNGTFVATAHAPVIIAAAEAGAVVGGGGRGGGGGKVRYTMSWPWSRLQHDGKGILFDHTAAHVTNKGAAAKMN